jgi:hypothetical protein
MLMQWPAFYIETVLVVLALSPVLIHSRKAAALGAVCALAATLGIVRVLRMRLELDSSSITVVNPIRTRVLEVDGSFLFSAELLTWLSPTPIVVQAHWGTKSLPLVASWMLSPQDRMRLLELLGEICSVTGSHCEVPMAWVHETRR